MHFNLKGDLGRGNALKKMLQTQNVLLVKEKRKKENENTSKQEAVLTSTALKGLSACVFHFLSTGGCCNFSDL